MSNYYDISFEKFKMMFKTALVRNYYWVIDDAYHFKSDKLYDCYINGLDFDATHKKVINKPHLFQRR